jgi:hypothetical protein
MGRGNKVDIVYSALLKPYHDCGKACRLNLIAFAPVADIIILAENAAQAAVGKKDGAGTIAAHQRFFLTKVRAIA